MALSTSVSSPEDVVNQALDLAGYDMRGREIADLNEGTPAARVALRHYSQARDFAFSRGIDGQPWPFSRADVLLSSPAKTKTTGYAGTWDPTTQPPPPWQYEFTLPADYIKSLNIMPVPTTPGAQLDPKPNLWKLADDNSASPGSVNGAKVILSQITPLVLVYIARVTDMSQWDSAFIEVVVADLRQRFTAALSEAEKAQLMGLEAQLGDKTDKAAAAIQP